LVAAETLASLYEIADRLPVPFASGALECRLGESPRVDLLLSLRGASDHPIALARTLSIADAGSAWQRIRDFCEQWSAPASPLAGPIPALWIEIDCDPETPAPPLPWGFLCVDRWVDAATARWNRAASESAADLPEIAAGLSLLAGRAPAPQVLACLGRCRELLSRHGRLLHVASLSSRGSDAVRIVAALDVRRLPEDLIAMGWPGSPDTVIDLLSFLDDTMEIVHIQLDLSTAVQPMLGLEVFYPGGAPDPRWPPLLDKLVSRGACSPAKRDALLSWPGECPSSPDGQGLVRLHRGMQVKIVHRPGVPLEAKAYLGFRHYFALKVPERPSPD
jgi:hypothetical protein